MKNRTFSTDSTFSKLKNYRKKPKGEFVWRFQDAVSTTILRSFEFKFEYKLRKSVWRRRLSIRRNRIAVTGKECDNSSFWDNFLCRLMERFEAVPAGDYYCLKRLLSRIHCVSELFFLNTLFQNYTLFRNYFSNLPLFRIY